MMDTRTHRIVADSPWNSPEAYRPNLYDCLDPIDLRVRQLRLTPRPSRVHPVAWFVGAALLLGAVVLTW